MNTVRALLVSVPSRLSRYTEPETRNPSVVGLPRLRVAPHAVRFHGYAPALRLGLRAVALAVSLPAGRFAPALRPPLAGEFRSLRCVLPHAKRT